MNKLPIPRLPANGDYQNLVAVLVPLLTQIVAQVNAMAEGRIFVLNGGTAPPTTGTWAQGDFYWNTAATPLGPVGSKYRIDYWRCIAAGTPGTWEEARIPTGG